MANFSRGLTGGLSGAGSGAGLGSFFGPVGTAIGAGAGGLLGGLGGLFSGGGQQAQQQQQQGGIPGQAGMLSGYTPENQSSFNDLISQILGQYKGGQFNFEPIAQQARTQFEQQTVPSIAERFGSFGGQQSSAFTQALGKAGAGLEGDLAAQQAQYGLQQQGLLQNLLGMGRQEPMFQEEQQGTLKSMLPSLISGLLSAGGSLGGEYIRNRGSQNNLKDILASLSANKAGGQ